MNDTALFLSRRAVLQKLSDLAISAGSHAQVGTFSTAIYDTAWLSMVYRRDTERANCLFPECFSSLIEQQQPDGTWKANGSPVDAIVNSLAALLSLATSAAKGQANIQKYDLNQRILQSTQGIEKLLRSWKISATAHVGFEVIVVSLLRQLDQMGLSFNFDGSRELNDLCTRKMQRFTHQVIYSDRLTSILHSAESLVGVIDFDKISHHCTATHGIFGSPAATAAYLSHATHWDTRAEAYLHKVVQCYGGTGRVPSAYPTCIFEISWAVSNIVSTPHVPDLQSSQILLDVQSFLRGVLRAQDGLVGFAPGVLPDADDTARVLITLARLGEEVDPVPMIQAFETLENFRTYDLERNPSFTTNCNVLLALLEARSAENFSPQILKTLRFLLQSWDSKSLSDKWNTSSSYSLMLLTECLTVLIRRYQEGLTWLLPENSDFARVVSVLCQIMRQLITGQNPGGSWDLSLEVTSYGALTLIHLLRLPWSESMEHRMRTSLSEAQTYIISNFESMDGDTHVWIEKTTFRVDIISMAYCTAAMATEEIPLVWRSDIRAMFSIPRSKIERMQDLLGNTTLFGEVHLESVESILMQAQWHGTVLQRHQEDILSRQAIPVTSGEYLKFIPFIWVACNSLSGDSLGEQVIRDMSRLSLYIYQIDEVMETMALELDREACEKVLFRLRQYCKLESRSFRTLTNPANSLQNPSQPLMGTTTSDSESKGTWSDCETPIRPSDAEEVCAILRRFVNNVLEHPAVVASTPYVRTRLAIDVFLFITAHMEHNDDNLAWERSQLTQSSFVPPDISRGGDFYGWVTSTASADTSCPFAFRFFSCIVSQSDQPCFRGPEAEFFSQSVARHLSVMCRLQNDAGSADRDSKEGNLSSLDFPEFEHQGLTGLGMGDVGRGIDKINDLKSSDTCTSVTLQSRKNSLATIANFQRQLTELAFERLSQVVQPTTIRALRVFVNVTDLFGQIYLLKDISSRKR